MTNPSTVVQTAMKLDRRTFLSALGFALAASPFRAWSMGKEDRFRIAQLQYDGSWNPRPTALRRVLLEVEKRTSVLVDPKPVVVDGTGKDLFEVPFLVWSGDRKFNPLPDDVVENLRTFLQYGGLLLVDSAEGIQNGPFLKSVERDLARILPGEKLSRIPKDHVIHKSFYLIDDPVGRLNISKSFMGIWDDDRVSVVVTSNDLQGAWARDMFGNFTYEVSPGGDRQRELSYRLGINLVMYALCLNYKADQVHIPFILRRRKWRVE